MTPREVLGKIFKDPLTRYTLTEFDGLGVDYENVLTFIEREGSGRLAGKKIYYLKSLAPFYSAKEEVQIYSEDGKSNPEEVLRQLWVYRLINYYGYRADEIELETPVAFGTDVNTKFADIVVYTNNEKTTPKIVIEVKKPKRKDGIEQLRSYLNAKGSPIGVWSNGSDKVILYRPYPHDFDALPEIPRRGQTADSLQVAKLTLSDLDKSFDFKKILLDLEELVLGSSGVNVFNEIFKIIFAKIWDEKQAIEVREDQRLEFKWFKDPAETYSCINKLFKEAAQEWKGVFDENDKIKLQKEHLNVCIAPLERKRFLGSNLRIIDDAFEYLLPTEAKKKKGQFFTPRFVIDLCVRMLNPKKTEYVLDPACGSAGFLVHTMEWAYPAANIEEMELRKSRYAARYLWGVDFEEQAAKTSRALMLIAGDGHTNIFGPDVDTLEPRTWYRTQSGRALMETLRRYNLTSVNISENESFADDSKAWEYFGDLKFDVILSNPPFAGEVKVKQQLQKYELAKPALKRARDKQAKEERDVLFIERILRMLKPGGRAAIVLPQGKFNNTSLAFIREWLLRKARLLAVVGLHGNSFKPHTPTKTSVIILQKYTEAQISEIDSVKERIKASCPDYRAQIAELINGSPNDLDLAEDSIPENIWELLVEEFSEREPETEYIATADGQNETEDQTIEREEPSLSEMLDIASAKIAELKAELEASIQGLSELELAESEFKSRQQAELLNVTNQWTGSSEHLRLHIRTLKDQQKEVLRNFKIEQKTRLKELRAVIKQLESRIPDAVFERNLLTNRGKLSIVLSDPELLQKLAERYIDGEVARYLDYPIFMAVSEYGGKNNRGEYEYVTDAAGNVVEDSEGNPVYLQDLVNYRISKPMLESMTVVEHPTESDGVFDQDSVKEATHIEQPLAIAEAFVRFAKEQQLNFWV